MHENDMMKTCYFFKIANEIEYVSGSSIESYKLIIDKLSLSTSKVFLLQAKYIFFLMLFI